MSKSEEKFVRWQDGLLPPKEAADFAADLDGETRADAESWAATRSLLQENLKAPRLDHPEFLTNRILNAIEHESRPARPTRPISFRLLWCGLAALTVAGLLTLVGLPASYTPPNEEAFISQVISARAGNPKSSVSTFKAPDSEGVIIWIDSSGYIPANETVR